MAGRISLLTIVLLETVALAALAGWYAIRLADRPGNVYERPPDVATEASRVPSSVRPDADLRSRGNTPARSSTIDTVAFPGDDDSTGWGV